MENGAQLQNSGTFNDNSWSTGCGYGNGSFDQQGGCRPVDRQHRRPSRSKQHEHPTGAGRSRLLKPGHGDRPCRKGDFTGGGIPGAAGATGCSVCTAPGNDLLDGGNFLIEEGGAFQVRVRGAT